jgi:hypothetical protein
MNIYLKSSISVLGDRLQQVIAQSFHRLQYSFIYFVILLYKCVGLCANEFRNIQIINKVAPR